MPLTCEPLLQSPLSREPCDRKANEYSEEALAWQHEHCDTCEYEDATKQVAYDERRSSTHPTMVHIARHRRSDEVVVIEARNDPRDRQQRADEQDSRDDSHGEPSDFVGRNRSQSVHAFL